MSWTTTNVYEGANAITASDTVNDPVGPFAGLLCTAAGSLKIHTIAGQDVTITAQAGTVIPIAVTRVWATGLTGSYIGLYTPQYRQPLNPGAGLVLP